MKKTLLATIALVLLVVPASADAQEQARTWVSQSGDDASTSCTFAEPCRTFARAAEPLTEGGEINAQTDGTFGDLAIEKGMTIDGRGHSVSITAFDAAIVVDAPGKRVTIRNLHINGFPGGSDGIDVDAVGDLTLSDVTIRSVEGHGIDFRSPPAPARLTVLDSSISEVKGQGIALSSRGTTPGGKRLIVRNSDISRNGASGIWTGAHTNANPVIIGLFDSTFADNVGHGVLADGTQTRVRIAQNVITGNLGNGLRTLNGGQILSYGNNRVYENAINGAPTSVIPQN